MCNFIFMNVGGMEFQGIVPFREDFIIEDVFEIPFDEEHQHVEMQYLFLFHTGTFPNVNLTGFWISLEPNTGCQNC